MITTGSGGQRYMSCIGSSVLPRAFDANETEYATRGAEIHAFLQRINEGMKPEDAIELVDERYRTAASEIDLEQLRDVLGLTAELSLAYNVPFDSARVLGFGLKREYEAAGCREDDVPMTLDVVGVNDPKSPTVGVVVDFKTGHGKQIAAEHNWQLRFGALALSRVYDLDIVHVQLITLRDGVVVWRDRATFTAADLAMFAAQARVRWDLVLRARDLYEKRRVMPDLTRGDHCRYCPSYHACPAQISLVHAAVSRDAHEDLTQGGPLPPEKIAEAWRLLRDIEEPRRRLKAAVYASAKERPVLLETLPDGTELWLGVTEVQGPTKIDADKARQVVREMLDQEAVDEVSVYEVSQGRIEAACKKRVAKGEGAKKFRAVMDELRKRGGAHRPVKHDVDTYKLAPGVATARVLA